MRYTVLIADDSKLQRVIVKENLKDIYDVAEASGGQECLDLVEHSAGKIDAVLLDIVMPGMDSRCCGEGRSPGCFKRFR